MSLLEISNLSHMYGDKLLYKNESLTLFKGEHMGIVGHNGVGKSTLVRILSGEAIPDCGQIVIQPKTKLGCLDQHAVIYGNQTMTEYLKTAFADLYSLEKKINDLYELYVKDGDDKHLYTAGICQETLESEGFYMIDSRIDSIMNGLGLSSIGKNKLVSELSGGQRAKLVLAKLLLEEPDVLLLDEPTNFLDKEHVEWLSGYLSSFPNAFVVVSHDFEFLEKVSNCICDIDACTLKKYTVKYSEFIRIKEQLKNEHIRRYTLQQKHIKKTEAFIQKNIAGTKSKSARGRRKQLERLEILEAPSAASSKPSFTFKEKSGVNQRLLKVKNLEVGYDSSLLPPISFSINRGQKKVISGFNGIGKTTLLNTITGRIDKISGEYIFTDNIRIGYYEQEATWDNLSQTPIELIREGFPNLSTKEVRRMLARCGINNEHATQTISTLSGGEQAKVKICKLMLSDYNILILDEPTNHLDGLAKEALKDALISFTGAVLIVSHEEAFYRGWTNEVIKL